MLAQADASAARWLELLRMCTEQPDQREQLQTMIDELAQFKTWAAEARVALRLIHDTRRVQAGETPRSGSF